MASLRLAAVDGIGVLVAHDEERLALEPAASRPGHRGCMAAPSQVVAPEADLVMVAPAIAIFRAVECGRRRMTRQQVQRDPADAHRHVPVALRGQRQHRELLWRIPARRQTGRPACRARGICGRCARAARRSENATTPPWRTAPETRRNPAHRRHRRRGRRCRDRSRTELPVLDSARKLYARTRCGAAPFCERAR